jgi:hypothetical protein
MVVGFNLRAIELRLLVNNNGRCVLKAFVAKASSHSSHDKLKAHCIGRNDFVVSGAEIEVKWVSDTI